MGLTITHNTFAYQTVEDEDYIIFQFDIANDQTSPIDNLYAGLFADWDINNALTNKNACSYDTTHKLTYTFDMKSSNSPYFGLNSCLRENSNPLDLFPRVVFF